MVYSNVDTIVRRTLLEKNLPIHFYSEMLFHTTAAIRELSFDTLKIINTVNLPVNEYSAADLPDDFVDDIQVFYQAGGLLQPLPKKESINPLRNIDTTTGQFVSWTNSPAQNAIVDNGYGLAVSSLWFWNISDYSEPTGRFFGARGGNQQGYKIVKERRQIQLTDYTSWSNIILQYISDGQSADNATMVDPQAIAAIQAYCSWKSSPNASIDISPEARYYYNQKRMLRARLNNLTVPDIINGFRNSIFAAIKN